MIEKNLCYFHDATKLLSGRQYPTLGLSHGVIGLLKDYFLKPSDISGNNRQKRLKEFETIIKEKVVSNIDIYFSQKKNGKGRKIY